METGLNFQEVLEMAKKSKSEEIYTLFNEFKGSLYHIAYGDTPAELFEALANRQSSKKIGSGTLRMIGSNVHFRKKYARKDELVTHVSFAILGYKRATTHLPAGVLVYNIQFYCKK